MNLEPLRAEVAIADFPSVSRQDIATIIPATTVPKGATSIKIEIPKAGWPKNSLVAVQLWRSEDGGINWIPGGGATADGTGGDFWVQVTFGEVPVDINDPNGPRLQRASDGTWLLRGHVTVVGDAMQAPISVKAQ